MSQVSTTKKEGQMSAKSPTASSKANKGFTAEEKAAMRQRAKELKASEDAAEAAKAVNAEIDGMLEADRLIAKKLHELIMVNAPALQPKLWYGMPAYFLDGKMICFFQTAQKFKSRYATFGFSDNAKLDEGEMWPVAYSLMKLTPTEEARIVALVKMAAR